MDKTKDNMPKVKSKKAKRKRKYNNKLVVSKDLKEIYKYISYKYSGKKNQKLYNAILNCINFGKK